MLYTSYNINIDNIKFKIKKDYKMSLTISPISPVAVSILGFDIRWYALAYIISFIICYFLFKKISFKQNLNFTKKELDDFLTYSILGVILGGRLGYVLFYNLPYFLENPIDIIAVWKGGMSFHGGLIGILTSIYLFMIKLNKEKKYNLLENLKNSFKIFDIFAIIAPIGLFFGRIANFINMEVMGRITNKPWGIIFEGFTKEPRHPSPLYEAFLEGFVLFIIMISLYKFTKLKNYKGILSGIFGTLYSIFRILCELFRQPDEQLGFLTSWGLTMGQLLSFLMFLASIIILITSIINIKKNKLK